MGGSARALLNDHTMCPFVAAFVVRRVRVRSGGPRVRSQPQFRGGFADFWNDVAVGTLRTHEWLPLPTHAMHGRDAWAPLPCTSITRSGYQCERNSRRLRWVVTPPPPFSRSTTPHPCTPCVDPFIVVSLSSPTKTSFREVGRTETVFDTPSPSFTTAVRHGSSLS